MWPVKRHGVSGTSKAVRGFGHGGSGRLPEGFSRADMACAEKTFAARSKRSQALDLVKMADIAPNIECWLKNPNRTDIPSIDSPDAALIFSHKSKRAQAIDLAKAAKRVPLEIWVRATNKGDIQGVDSKGSKVVTKPTKPLRRFRVYTKKVAEELEKKKKRLGRKLPTKSEILARATENRMEKEIKQGLPGSTPEEKELKETGEFQKAQSELMRGESSEVHSQIESYVHDLNEQLEPEGFKVIPID